MFKATSKDIVGFWSLNQARFQLPNEPWINEKIEGGALVFSPTGMAFLVGRTSESEYAYSGEYQPTKDGFEITVKSSFLRTWENQILTRKIEYLSKGELRFSMPDLNTGALVEAVWSRRNEGEELKSENPLHGFWKMIKIENKLQGENWQEEAVRDGSLVFSRHGQVALYTSTSESDSAYVGVYSQSGNAISIQLDLYVPQHHGLQLSTRTIEKIDQDNLMLSFTDSFSGVSTRSTWKRS